MRTITSTFVISLLTCQAVHAEVHNASHPHSGANLIPIEELTRRPFIYSKVALKDLLEHEHDMGNIDEQYLNLLSRQREERIHYQETHQHQITHEKNERFNTLLELKDAPERYQNAQQVPNFEFETEAAEAMDQFESVAKSAGIEYASKKYTTTIAMMMVMLGIISALVPFLWFQVFQCGRKSLSMDENKKQMLYLNPKLNNAADHYEANMCITYPNEEEYLQQMLLQEQKKMALKIQKERERWLREDILQRQHQNSMLDVADDNSMEFIAENDHPPSSAPSEIRSLSSPRGSIKSLPEQAGITEELLNESAPMFDFTGSAKKSNSDITQDMSQLNTTVGGTEHSGEDDIEGQILGKGTRKLFN